VTAKSPDGVLSIDFPTNATSVSGQVNICTRRDLSIAGLLSLLYQIDASALGLDARARLTFVLPAISARTIPVLRALSGAGFADVTGSSTSADGHEIIAELAPLLSETLGVFAAGTSCLSSRDCPSGMLCLFSRSNCAPGLCVSACGDGTMDGGDQPDAASTGADASIFGDAFGPAPDSGFFDPDTGFFDYGSTAVDASFFDIGSSDSGVSGSDASFFDDILTMTPDGGSTTTDLGPADAGQFTVPTCGCDGVTFEGACPDHPWSHRGACETPADAMPDVGSVEPDAGFLPLPDSGVPAPDV
jgi:hypothetical protein